ncbi:hypothetical protein JB92DRAFT_1554183 [Gautieria morchelliformis]|nr:hypothetical protein JB92DRAFT_1554183 [Gautieria morchelliformis]
MALDEKTKQGMESGLEHAVRIVRTRISQFEQNILLPCMESSRQFAYRRPIAAILVSVFSLLSLLPVASFMGFVILVTATFVSIGLGSALIASTLLIVVAGGVLASILGTLLVASILVTGAVVTVFVTFRLVRHLASQGDLKQGVVGWARETRIGLRWPAPESAGSLVINHDQVKKEPSVPSSLEEWHPMSNGSGDRDS